MNRGPVFVAGIERSGTSLMYALLASHPNIAMTRRTNLWTFFYNQYGDLSQPDNLERCLNAMVHYRRLVALKIDPDRLRREFPQGEPTYARLFALIEEHHAEKVGKPRWGDKSVHTERYVDDIFPAYPGAKVLHMMRDPRDRYASSLTRWKKMRGGVGVGTALWLASAALARRNQQRYPDRYKVVRYETLAAQPEETLQEICAFIGEDYSPAMLSMDGVESLQGGKSSYTQKETRGISTKSIGRFRQVLSKRDIAFMQAQAREDMIFYNYEIDPLQLSPGEQLLYSLVDWPLNQARMLAWRTREAIESRKGRTPPDHTILDNVELQSAVE